MARKKEQKRKKNPLLSIAGGILALPLYIIEKTGSLLVNIGRLLKNAARVVRGLLKKVTAVALTLAKFTLRAVTAAIKISSKIKKSRVKKPLKPVITASTNRNGKLTKLTVIEPSMQARKGGWQKGQKNAIGNAIERTKKRVGDRQKGGVTMTR
ncbi:MAG: hypothetical protein AAFO99_16025 [Bacteroidota bacterium]